MYCRVIGSVRSNQDKKTVMVFKISQISDMAEVDAHQLEVLHARLKIKQLKSKENASIFGNSNDNGLSNSMMGSYGGAGKLTLAQQISKTIDSSTSFFQPITRWLRAIPLATPKRIWFTR